MVDIAYTKNESLSDSLKNYFEYLDNLILKDEKILKLKNQVEEILSEYQQEGKLPFIRTMYIMNKVKKIKHG